MNSEIVLSGIRATGPLHFGNFFGAIRHFVTYQNEGHAGFFFIADWHTLTTFRDSEAIRKNVIEIATGYLAAGVDPKRSMVFVQSSVPELAELALCLSMLQSHRELLRLATLKDLIKDKKTFVNLGLIGYPVLMAADILGPKATLIPVGADQVPNVELAQRLASRFNREYGELFPIPEMMREMVKVPGMHGGKMAKSKSDDAIPLLAPKGQILQRYLEDGITDPNRARREDPGNPDKCVSVYPMYKIVASAEEISVVNEQCRGATIGCVECKRRLVDRIAESLGPFRDRFEELSADPSYIRDVLAEGGKKMRLIVRETLEEVRKRMGLIRY